MDHHTRFGGKDPLDLRIISMGKVRVQRCAQVSVKVTKFREFTYYPTCVNGGKGEVHCHQDEGGRLVPVNGKGHTTEEKNGRSGTCVS